MICLLASVAKTVIFPYFLYDVHSLLKLFRTLFVSLKGKTNSNTMDLNHINFKILATKRNEKRLTLLLKIDP